MLQNEDSGKAVMFFDSAFYTIVKPGIGDLIDRYKFKSDVNYRRHNMELTINHLDSILLLLSTDRLKEKYAKQYVTSMFNKGDILFELREYQEAYKYYYQGKIIARTIMDRCTTSGYSYRLGMVSYKQGKYQKSTMHFRQCFEDLLYCSDDFQNFAMSQEVLSNLSLSYFKQGIADSAVIYNNRALAFIKENESKYPDKKVYIESARGVLYGNRADLFFRSGDLKNAKRSLLKSIAINSKKGFDNQDAQITLLKLGELYFNSNQLPQAMEVAQKLKFSLDSIKNPVAEIGLSKLNWNYFDKLRQEDSAYIYLQEYLKLKDSQDAVNKKLVMADFEKEFQLIEEQNSYIRLSKDNDLKKIMLFVVVLFSLMTLVILFLLWKKRKASRRSISALTRLNKQITFQNVQLEQTLADLMQSSKDKDRILKVVAHDLRNPVGAIANISTILLDEIQFSEEHAKLVELIKESSWQSIEMINDLLTANTANSSFAMKLEWMDMSELIFKCVDQLRFKAEEKGQLIKLVIGSDVRIKGDREKLGRVMSNLIINAIKFSPLNAEIRVGMKQEGETIELFIEDNGIGIPASFNENVFDMFGDSKRPGTAGEQPFGIGLPFSKQIVEAHGGKIWFESEINKGTTFYIRLPKGEETFQ
ncbi:tetratricopeptide repeat-containing sensor histidine kinase [Dyadobacter sp. NIV53]|uniref:tetratricopeptide repeat-containing sensor histidine kinase n=1 Tax=Dyadobacter sp. NIV53 TaxID=2861765 RepID=UPI001C86915A|nr:tetratricopeptide repeat-containing sensor histidine kinase [Dyadobacter sp. NIV53]